MIRRQKVPINRNSLVTCCLSAIILACALCALYLSYCTWNSYSKILQDEDTHDFLMMQETAQRDITMSNIRILTDSQQTNSFMDTNNPKSNVYLILLIIGICILVLGGIAFCILFLLRYFAGDRRTGPKVANSSGFKLNVDLISPAIEYSLFETQIGKPLQDNCVICLEPYVSKSKNKINSLQSADNLQTSNKVSMTVCGHLLHEKCLKQWLQREPNCPLCREQFSEQNLQKWEQKLQIQFNLLYELIIEKNIRAQKYQSLIKKEKNKCNLQSKKLSQVQHNSQQMSFQQIRNSKYSYSRLIDRLSKGASRPIKLRLVAISNDNNNSLTIQGRSCSLDTIQPSDMYALVIYNAVISYQETKNQCISASMPVKILNPTDFQQ